MNVINVYHNADGMATLPLLTVTGILISVVDTGVLVS